MKIISLKEFYEGKTNKNIEEYLLYLREKKGDLGEILEIAASYAGKDASSVIEIQNRIDFITELENILLNCINDEKIIFNSVRNITTNGVKEIIENYLNRYREEKKDIKTRIDEIKSRKKNLEIELKTSLEKMFMNTTFNYLTIGFFDEIKSKQDYISILINSPYEKEGLKKLFSVLNYSDEINENLASLIIALRKIIKIDDEKLFKEILDSLLDTEKVCQILQIEDREIANNFFKNLQIALKTKTKFFQNLPEETKTELLKHNIYDCETYDLLYKQYLEYSQKGQITIDEEEFLGLSKEIASNQEKLSQLNKEIEKIKEKSYEGQVEYIVSKYEQNKEKRDLNNLSAIIDAKATYDSIEMKKNTISELNEELITLCDLEKRIEYFIKPIKLSAFKKQVKLEILGDIEKKLEEIIHQTNRSEQFIILRDFISTLNEIKSKIEAINQNRSLWKKISNKKEKKLLLEQYKQTIEMCMQTLEEKGYLNVGFVDYSNSKNFDEFINRTPITDLTKMQLTKEEYDFCASMGYIQRIPSSDCFENVKNYVPKLFSAKKNEDGTYNFDIDKCELHSLLYDQTIIDRCYEQILRAVKEGKSFFLNLSDRSAEPDNVFGELSKLLKDLRIEKSRVSEGFLKGQFDILEEILKEQHTHIRERILKIRNNLDILNIDLKNTKINQKYLSYYYLIEGFDEMVISPDTIIKGLKK